MARVEPRFWRAIAEELLSQSPGTVVRRLEYGDPPEVIDLTLSPDTPEIKERNKRKRYKPKRIQFVDLTRDN